MLGGLVDIRTDAELPEKPLSGYLAVDVYQTTAYAQAKVGKNTALTVSARRSYIDAVLNPIFAATGADAVRAPATTTCRPARSTSRRSWAPSTPCSS